MACSRKNSELARQEREERGAGLTLGPRTVVAVTLSEMAAKDQL